MEDVMTSPWEATVRSVRWSSGPPNTQTPPLRNTTEMQLKYAKLAFKFQLQLSSSKHEQALRLTAAVISQRSAAAVSVLCLPAAAAHLRPKIAGATADFHTQACSFSPPIP
jgi:hypothetical protein